MRGCTCTCLADFCTGVDGRGMKYSTLMGLSQSLADFDQPLLGEMDGDETVDCHPGVEIACC